MSGRKKFEPEKIAAALRLLRALPVKDNRKSTGEALHMLKGGICDALEKGYDRTEIRKLIAPEVLISATTFNDFLAENLKTDAPETGKDAESKQTTDKENAPQKAEQTEKAPTVKPESPATAKRKSPPPETETPASGKRNSPDSEPPKTTSARKAELESESEPLPSYYTPDLPDSEL